MAESPRCSVENCGSDAIVEVLLYDFYAEVPNVFLERDFTCPFLCAKHLVQNEQQAFTGLTQTELRQWIEDLQDILKQTPPSVSGRMMEGAPKVNVSRIKREPKVVSLAEVLSEPAYHLPPIRQPRGNVSYPFTNRDGAQGFTVYRKLE